MQKFSVHTQIDELTADLMQACVIAKLAQKYPQCAAMLFELRYIWSYPSSATHFGAFRVSQELMEEHGGDPAKALRWVLAQPYEQLVQNLGPRIQVYNDRLELGDSPMTERLGHLSRGGSWFGIFDNFEEEYDKLVLARKKVASEGTLTELFEQYKKDANNLAEQIDLFLKKYSPQGFKLR